MGTKEVWYSDLVHIEADDAVHLSKGEKVTFINWGNVVIREINRLKKYEIRTLLGAA